MKDADLAQLRAEAEEAQRILSGSYTISAVRMRDLMTAYGERCAENIPQLLDAVERLRELARDVANYPEYKDGDLWLDILRNKARALLE